MKLSKTQIGSILAISNVQILVFGMITKNSRMRQMVVLTEILQVKKRFRQGVLIDIQGLCIIKIKLVLKMR
jgi:hypothetical protein